MGKAKEFKRQRKIEKEQSVEKKEKRKILITKSIIALVGIMVFSVCLYMVTIYAKEKWFNGNKETKTEETINRKYDKAPAMTIDTSKTYIAKFETDKGNFEVTLNAKDAPKTVNNFVFLARNKFYDGLTFHRIVKDFMIQGGDPQGDGAGGPGYTIPAEIKLKHTKGAIATARMGDQANPKKDSSGSQFFIDFKDQPSLDQGGYTVFGYVTKGMDVVEKFAEAKVEDNGQGEQSKPVDKQIIKSVTIEEK